MIYSIAKGVTRKCFLIGRYAIKIPRTYSWEAFLLGILGNLQERSMSPAYPQLCPVIFSLFGFINIMPRVTPICYSEEALQHIIQKDFTIGGFRLPVEPKSSSFGYLNGKLVAVDYGGR